MTQSLPAYDSHNPAKRRARDPWIRRAILLAIVPAVLFVGFVGGLSIYVFVKCIAPQAAATTYVLTNSEAFAELGRPLRVSHVGRRVALGEGKAVVSFQVTGPAGTARAVVAAHALKMDWQVDAATLEHDGRAIDISPRASAF
jgi:hypothetical protein